MFNGIDIEVHNLLLCKQSMTDENHTQYYPCPKCHKKGWHGVRKPTTQPNIVSPWYWSCRYCSHTKTKTR